MIHDLLSDGLIMNRRALWFCNTEQWIWKFPIQAMNYELVSVNPCAHFLIWNQDLKTAMVQNAKLQCQASMTIVIVLRKKKPKWFTFKLKLLISQVVEIQNLERHGIWLSEMPLQFF